MKQREISDQDNTIWNCVQAYSGTDSKEMAEKVAELEANGTVAVVCTPNGGAQSVRLQLAPDWLEALTDVQLLQKIQQQAKAA
jgi:hypothetical protein